MDTINSAMVENSSPLELKKQLQNISDENSSEIEQSVVSGDSVSERKDEICPKTNSEETLPMTNSEETLPKINSEETLPKTNSEETLPKTNSKNETTNGTDDDMPISNGDVNGKDDHENPSEHSEEAVDKVTEKSDMEVDSAADKDCLSDKIEETKESETTEDVADKSESDEGHQNENAKTDDEKIKIVELESVVGDVNDAGESGSNNVDAVEQNASIHAETVESVSSDKEAEVIANNSGDSCKESELLLREGEKREEEKLQESTEEGECGKKQIVAETKACTAEGEVKSSVGDESVVKAMDDSSCAEKDVHSQDDVAENMKEVDLDELGTEDVSVLMTTEIITEQEVIVSNVSVTSSEVELIVTEENSPEEVFVEDGPVSSNNVEIIESPKEVIPTESPRPTSRQQLSGVQKTEQPYDKCTTETKIAMEIREMREREEELRMMRERQAYLHSESDSERSLSPGSSRPPSASSQYQLLSSSQPSQSPEPLLLPPGPGYRVSSVFGHKGVATSPAAEEEQKPAYRIYKESQVEREIRLARDREEELRKEKGLPPREDDSYIKPSQVKSSQTRVFCKINGNCENQRLLATFKIQQEIEEQTQREMALRETGQIQTISEERTDSKVASLREKDAADTVRTPPASLSLASKLPSVTNGHAPGVFPAKEAVTSPTNSVHSGVNPVSRVMTPGPGKGINMEKFISSRGKEMTFSAPKNGSLFGKSQLVDGNRSGTAARPLVKVKRTVSVESKIHQEIMELKAREEELKLLHRCQPQHLSADGDDHQASSRENLQKRENGQALCDDEDSSDASSPRHNVLIAQWEQRIQEAEGRA